MSTERKKPDYSKCMIYKLYSKDEAIKDIYVGHSTQIIRRYKEHKRCSNNMNSTEYKYRYIREKSTFENWKIEILEFYPCDDIREATKREQYWINILGAKLNKNKAHSGDIIMEENSNLSNPQNKIEKEKVTKKIQRYIERKEKLKNILADKEELERLNKKIKRQLSERIEMFIERNK